MPKLPKIPLGEKYILSCLKPIIIGWRFNSVFTNLIEHRRLHKSSSQNPVQALEYVGIFVGMYII